MAKEQRDLIRSGTLVWNQWRKKNPLVEIHLWGENLEGAILNGVNLEGALLSGTNLIGADLHEANLRGASLNGAKLDGANLRRADLREASFTRARLLGSDLSYCPLKDADFSQADSTRINLMHARLIGAKFHLANFCDSNLSRANLTHTILTRTKLARANLTHADLSRAILVETELYESNLGNARIGWTTLANIDFSTSKGLETVCHEGPSTIGLDTIYRSKGIIPEVFLRGAGASDSFITYLTSLTGKAFEFYSCFISYSNKDQSLATRLHADLQDKGVRCWFAPEDLKIGDRIRARIDDTIRTYDKLLLVLSENSIASQWVEQEVETALEKERELSRAILFPIRLDHMIMNIKTGWPALIKNTRHIGDFSGWKDHDMYLKAFNRLLRDLKADEVDDNRT